MAVEPNINTLPEGLASTVFLASQEDACEQCDIIVLLVEHKPFKSTNMRFKEIAQVIDTKGIVNEMSGVSAYGANAAYAPDFYSWMNVMPLATPTLRR